MEPSGNRRSVPCVTEAIFGLVGVVIGGALAGGIDYVARRRDER